MRHEKLENLFDLALEMHIKRFGISLKDIMEKYSVSRRTAMRMKDTIINLFPSVDVVVSDSKIKRWSIPNSNQKRLFDFNSEDLSSLDFSIKYLENNNFKETSKKLKSLKTKISSQLSSSLLSSIETDQEVLVQNEVFSFKIGPQPNYNKRLLADIRYSIKACKKCEVKYKRKNYHLEPYGILFDHRHYLVAVDLKHKKKKLKYYSLSEISNFKISNEYFTRDSNLSTKNLIYKSFGVFDEKPFDVEIIFSKKVSSEVKKFLFHPSQRFINNKNGSVTLQFRSGGLIEMVWYFFKWGNHIDIKKPIALKKHLQKNLKSWNIIP